MDSRRLRRENDIFEANLVRMSCCAVLCEMAMQVMREMLRKELSDLLLA